MTLADSARIPARSRTARQNGASLEPASPYEYFLRKRLPESAGAVPVSHGRAFSDPPGSHEGRRRRARVNRRLMAGGNAMESESKVII